MKNLTTRYFCRKFEACRSGTRFALRYKTMRECYNALLAGEAGANSWNWALWVISLDDVMTDRDLQMFAIRCARRVARLITNERSLKTLDVAERYIHGDAKDEELYAAAAAARDALWAVKDALWAVLCATRSVYAGRDALHDVWSAVRASIRAVADEAAMDAEKKAQLEILKEFGNPFEENEK